MVLLYLRTLPSFAAYAASKAALNQALRVEMSIFQRLSFTDRASSAYGRGIEPEKKQYINTGDASR